MADNPDPLNYDDPLSLEEMREVAKHLEEEYGIVVTNEYLQILADEAKKEASQNSEGE